MGGTEGEQKPTLCKESRRETIKGVRSEWIGVSPVLETGEVGREDLRGRRKEGRVEDTYQGRNRFSGEEVLRGRRGDSVRGRKLQET